MANAAELMDRQYRYQRYVYDLTRKYYLLGRDVLLDEIQLQPGDTVLEIGCGTARNLCRLAHRYPDHALYGLDASTVMLATAQKTWGQHRCFRNIHLQQGLAETWSPLDFGLQRPFDHLIFSYSLSMIPDWRSALDHALAHLAHNGTLHIVDFSLQRQLPPWFGRWLKRWLHWFNVHPEPQLASHLLKLQTETHGQCQLKTCYGDYAILVHFQKK